MLIGGRNQQVYRRVIERSPKEIDRVYKKCLADPSSECIEDIWGLEGKQT
jgi:hypothetical protein